MSNKSNNQITEAINLNEVTSILLNKGFMLLRPEVDFDGVDFLLKTPLGFIQKCELKSRAYLVTQLMVMKFFPRIQVVIS